jgi:hypothetical protein
LIEGGAGWRIYLTCNENACTGTHQETFTYDSESPQIQTLNQ